VELPREDREVGQGAARSRDEAGEPRQPWRERRRQHVDHEHVARPRAVDVADHAGPAPAARGDAGGVRPSIELGHDRAIRREAERRRERRVGCGRRSKVEVGGCGSPAHHLRELLPGEKAHVASRPQTARPLEAVGEGPRGARRPYTVFRQFGILLDRGVPLYAILGNHDVAGGWGD
jgi:hypothetical protein